MPPAAANGRWFPAPATPRFGDASLPATTVTFSAPGSYLLRLTATNAHGAASRVLSVNVAENPAYLADWQSANWPGVTDESIIGSHKIPTPTAWPTSRSGLCISIQIKAAPSSPP